MKKCPKCETSYREPLENHFSKNRSKKDGFQTICITCYREYHKNHYQNNKNYYKKKASEHNKKYTERNYQYVLDFLRAHPCVDCGESDPVVLEFDHLRDKEIAVSKLIHIGTLDNLKKEIEKCEVRCANCHRRKTAIQFNWYKA